MNKDINPNEINLVRIYNAPVKAVWDAWTDPNQAAKWWGPRGFTITTKSKDLRPGGHWVYTMHGPDGVDWPNITKYYEVENFSKLVYDHGGNEDQPPLFRVTALFSEQNGKTMDMTMAFQSEEARLFSQKMIKQANGNSTWDRLSEYLEKESSGKEKFVINRSFNVPISVMFEIWTNPNHIAKWLAPTGSTMKFFKSDIKLGGKTFYMMTTDTGLKMYGRAEYLEMTKPNRIVYTQQFCDENENLSRHPMAPTWPATMLTTVSFFSEGDTQTRVTIEWEAYGDYTPEEMATFVSARAGMTQGWTGSFDKLDDFLVTL
jgi:uncharacterized protein YndB with AHSA1/START domain